MNIQLIQTVVVGLIVTAGWSIFYDWYKKRRSIGRGERPKQPKRKLGIDWKAILRGFGLVYFALDILLRLVDLIA